MGCGGRLTADFGIGLVTCAGRFNEERGVFVKCFFKAQLRDITGRTPWRTSPPTAGTYKIECYYFLTLLKMAKAEFLL